MGTFLISEPRIVTIQKMMLKESHSANRRKRSILDFCNKKKMSKISSKKKLRIRKIARKKQMPMLFHSVDSQFILINRENGICKKCLLLNSMMDYVYDNYFLLICCAVKI